MMNSTTTINNNFSQFMEGIKIPHNLFQIDDNKCLIHEDMQQTIQMIQERCGKYKAFKPDMIVNVEFFPPAVKMTFRDGTVTSASAKEGDSYDPEMGMMMCINKYIWKGSSYNTFFRKWIKREEERKAMIQARKDEEEKERRRSEKRRKKNAERIARKKAAEREEAIQIQAEAYKRAMASGEIKEA